MPVANRPIEPARGPKTICIPCSQQQYERIVDDPILFREFLDRQIGATPELFPPEISRGFRMKDIYTSRKTGWKLRRIDLRNDQSYLIRRRSRPDVGLHGLCSPSMTNQAAWAVVWVGSSEGTARPSRWAW